MLRGVMGDFRATRDARGRTLVERIEAATELPMLFLALCYVVVFIAGYVPDLPAAAREAAGFAEDAIIALFAAEFLLRLVAAERRIAYLRAHWLDAIIVLVPFLRPLRLLRLLRFVPLLLRATVGLRRVMRRYYGINALAVGLVAVVISAVLVAAFERDGGGPIHGIGDALWWAAATVTTVGYGDVTPVTPEGRAVAVFLMVVGIALFGVLTAGVAAYFVESSGRELVDRLDKLEAGMEEQRRLLVVLIERLPQPQ